MTPAEQDLARQLADHPAWKWMRGMSADSKWSRWLCGSEPSRDFVPDLADPATQGCLLAMLPVPRVSVYGTGEVVVTAGDEPRCEGATLGEALARAWLVVQVGAS